MFTPTLYEREANHFRKADLQRGGNFQAGFIAPPPVLGKSGFSCTAVNKNTVAQTDPAVLFQVPLTD